MKKKRLTIFSAAMAAALTVQPVIAADVMPEEELIVSEAPAEAAKAAVVSKLEGVSGVTLSDAILMLKDVIGDTQDYENFDYSYNEQDGFTVYDLYWSGSKERNDLNVSVGSDGTVYSYNHYIDFRASYIIIPEITKSEALDIALEFALRLNPKYADTLSKDYATVSYSTNGSYSVRFFRHIGDTRVDGEYVNVTVTHDGRIYRMTTPNMTSNITMPGEFKDADAKIIKDAFNKEMPYTLSYYTYRPENPDEKYEIRLRYVPSNDFYSNVIDSQTGEVYTIVYDNGSNYAGGFGMASDTVAEEEVAAAPQSNKYALSAAETKAVELQDSFITAEEAVEKVKALGVLPEDEFTLTYNNLTESESPFTGAMTYNYSLGFTGSAKENGEPADVYHAEVNAETGEVTSYSFSSDSIRYKLVSERKYSDEECRKAAEKFLEANYGDIFGEYRIAAHIPERVYNENSRVTFYNYPFFRYANDIMYSDDSISISIDPDTLKVVSLNIDHCDGEFVSPDGILSAEEALDSYWDKIAPVPVYKAAFKYGDGKLSDASGSMKAAPALMARVYRFDSYCYVDAFSGELLNYSSRAYTVNKTEYFKEGYFSDIGDSSYADAIRVLTDMDFIEAGDKFRPEDKATVGEFMEMLRYFNTSYYRDAANDKLDENAEISREEAAKVVIESMGHGEIAKLEGIFKCAFTDADKLSDGYIGYVAIAQAMGLLDLFGDTLLPQSMLTRGEAAQIIYDYLLTINE